MDSDPLMDPLLGPTPRWIAPSRDARIEREPATRGLRGQRLVARPHADVIDGGRGHRADTVTTEPLRTDEVPHLVVCRRRHPRQGGALRDHVTLSPQRPARQFAHHERVRGDVGAIEECQ